MKENKVFKSVYGAVLVIFIISSVMLGSRLAKLHRGNEFYRQIGGGRGIHTNPGGLDAQLRAQRYGGDHPDAERAGIQCDGMATIAISIDSLFLSNFLSRLFLKS